MWTQLLLLFLFTAGALAQPARIASTSPSITETLFAIGAGPNVVGVSSYCKYPDAANALPKVGTYRKPDAERIALLRPDLVLLNESATDIANRLDALGIRHTGIRTGSLRDTFVAMRQIGDAVKRRSEADALIQRVENLIAQARGSAGAQKRRALIVVGRDPDSLTGLVVAGPRSYLGELLEAAGGTNAIEGSGLPIYPHISLETVMRADPDVIIDAGAMGDRPEENEAHCQRVLAAWLARGDLRAVKQHRVYPVFSSAFTIPGPRMIEVLEFLAGALHGGKP